MKYNIPYDEAIELYYKLKNNYEQNKRDHYRNTHGKKSMPKCISCRKHVGSKFTTTIIQDDTFYGRRLSATCGDIKNPCTLNIQIDIDYFHPFKPMLDEYLKNIDKYKLEIIHLKNNKMFFDIDTISEFNTTSDKLKDIVKDYTITNQQFLESIKCKNMDPYYQELYEKIYANNQLLNRYIKDPKDELIRSFMENYINEIVPIQHKIRSTKYAVNYVEANKHHIYNLVQNTNKLEDYLFPKDTSREYNIINLDGIYSSGKTTKTRKNKKVPKQTTLRMKK